MTVALAVGGGLAIFKDSRVQSVQKKGDGGGIFADQQIKQHGGRLTFQNCSAPRVGWLWHMAYGSTLGGNAERM